MKPITAHQSPAAISSPPLDDYFDQCRARVALFTHTHFSLGGTIRIHRGAFGKDLLIASVNVLLALPAAVALVLKLALRRTRWQGAARFIGRFSFGFPTSVEKSLVRLLAGELLGLATTRPPFARTWATSAHAAALEGTRFADMLEATLARYAAARRAAADITTALVVGLGGLIVFGQFSPGSFSAGRMLADTVAREAAVREFWLGDTLGGWYYNFFSPDTSALLTIGAILSLMLVLCVCAAFAGLIADPLLKALRLHQRRLHRLLRSLENSAHSRSHTAFEPKDSLYARFMDVFDILKGVWPG